MGLDAEQPTDPQRKRPDRLRATDAGRIAHLAQAVGDGDADAFDELYRMVYAELSSLAVRIAGPRDGTLNPTALVHELFLRLANAPNRRWEGQQHFLAVAARAMRQLLADHARRRGALKRGEAHDRVTLDDDVLAGPGSVVDAVALNDALERLAALDERQARAVELRYLGGLENKEIAELLGVALRTVELDLQMARAFLRKELDDD